MAHNYNHGDTTFICNSDLSGDVTIVEGDGRSGVRIPVQDLLDFVGSRLGSEVIGIIEQLRGRDILKIAFSVEKKGK